MNIRRKRYRSSAPHKRLFRAVGGPVADAGHKNLGTPEPSKAFGSGEIRWN